MQQSRWLRFYIKEVENLQKRVQRKKFLSLSSRYMNKHSVSAKPCRVDLSSQSFVGPGRGYSNGPGRTAGTSGDPTITLRLGGLRRG